MKNQRKKGFTLIELLVVITIIGILAGIAFVGFGDVFGSAGRTTAQKNLKTVYESLAAKTRSFPMSDEVSSVEKFVVWWRNKTKDTRPELWFIGEDEEVKGLAEDEDSDGIPANIPDDDADFKAEQVCAPYKFLVAFLFYLLFSQLTHDCDWRMVHRSIRLQ